MEKSTNATQITKEIINVGKKIKENYKNADVFISQLPPRGDRLNWVCQNINTLMKDSLPESLHIIDNTNITIEMLYDKKKHIKKESIGRLVYNMKKSIRKVINNRKNEMNTKRGYKENDSSFRNKNNNNMNNDKVHIDKLKFFQMMDSMKEIMNGHRDG